MDQGIKWLFPLFFLIKQWFTEQTMAVFKQHTHKKQSFFSTFG